MEHNDKEWLAAEYAMGTLRGAERAAFEQLIQTDASLKELVKHWSDRLCMFDAAKPLSFGGLSDDQVDAALDAVLRQVTVAIDQSLVKGAGPAIQNPFLMLTPQQRASARPVVVRLLASYIVLLERLKAQQRAQSAGLSASPAV